MCGRFEWLARKKKLVEKRKLSGEAEASAPWKNNFKRIIWMFEKKKKSQINACPPICRKEFVENICKTTNHIHPAYISTNGGASVRMDRADVHMV